MSYHDNRYGGGGAAGGGYRGPKRAPYNPDSDRRPRDAPPPPESQGERLRKQILAVGDGLEFDAPQDLPRLVRAVEHQFSTAKEPILEGFTYGITEQPYKIPYYATLIYLLCCPAKEEDARINLRDGDAAASEALKRPEVGGAVVEYLVRAFRTWVDERRWRETRLLIHLFAHLASAGVVAAGSLLALLQSFLAVVEELGVSAARAERAVVCVGEGLLRGGAALVEHDPEATSGLLAGIEVFVMTRTARRDLVAPFGVSLANDALPEDDNLVHLYRALRETSLNAFAPPKILPQPYLLFPDEKLGLDTPCELPAIIVPPESMGGADKAVGSEGWSTCELRFFDEEIVPSPSSPSGWVLRQLTLDVIAIFEVNRKECARLLLEFPNWFESGTFKPPPNVQLPPSADPDAPVPTWSLESLIVSAVLSNVVLLPAPQFKTIYYTSLLTELCKLSPGTVAPPVGKCARRLYAALDQGLDVECARRAADWLSVHLSNFGFQWLWKDWVPDLVLPRLHPKVSFIRRVVELETRLSYHDRIKGTLPEAMQDPAANVLPEDAETPYYIFENAEHEHNLTASRLETLMRSKTPPEAILDALIKFPLQPADEPLTALTRSIAVQTYLYVGSRSFSHFLNATERYLPVLREVAKTETARVELLRDVAQVWRSSGQWRLIITDKLLQYGIVGGEDVVRFLFELDDGALGPAKVGDEWMSGQRWDVLRGAVDKIAGRVVADKRRIASMEEVEERRTVMSTGGASTDAALAADETAGGTPASTNRALEAARAAFVSHQQTHKQTLLATLTAFVAALVPADGAQGSGLPGLIAKGGWSGRDAWDDADWIAWSQWGWYREFCRLYVHHLAAYRETIDAVVFGTLQPGEEGSDSAQAVGLVKGVWAGVLEVIGSSA